MCGRLSRGQLGARARTLDRRRRVRHATRNGSTLSSAYYLGRDLLELRDEHLTSTRVRTPSSLGHAIELLAAGDPVRAQTIVEHCATHHPTTHPADVAATLAACLLARGQLALAVEPLERAIAAEPAWPLHHWNLASTLHALGDTTGCYHALRRLSRPARRARQPARLVGRRPGRAARPRGSPARRARAHRAPRWHAARHPPCPSPSPPDLEEAPRVATASRRLGR